MKTRKWNFEENEKESGFASAVFHVICMGLMFWAVIILSAAFI